MLADEIMLIEDNRGDVLLLREAFERTRGANAPKITALGDGVVALDLLRARAAASPPRLPDLVLLDLNLPRMDGAEILRQICAEPAFRHLPVMIFTSSSSDQHVAAAHGLPPEHYLVKPSSFRGFVEIAERLGRFLDARRRP